MVMIKWGNTYLMEDKIPTNTSNNKEIVQFYAMKGNI
jgi:hypothetical protein